MSRPTVRQRGLTYIELMVALAIAAVLLLGLNGVVGRALQGYDQVRERNDLSRQARFAMERMLRAVAHTRRLLLPLNDMPASNWRENVREETLPPSPPEGDSTRASAVLAVTLPRSSDLDGDGIPDADDDRDGRIDEDLPNDSTYDFAAGIYLIDDDGDGQVDESTNTYDDDETDNVYNEDPIDGSDDDGDNNLDEDPASDNNGDGCPGICGVDDDGDGQVDEGTADDDDEDGGEYDDWYNALVFYLDNGALIQRTPTPWDENGSGLVSGMDFILEPIADRVTRFRVERIPQNGDRMVRVDLTLELTSPVSGETVSLHTQVRVGGAR